jgi:hypothetical protein
MSRQQKEPLRAMTEEEEAWLQRIARATREPANHVIRAKQLVAVAAGQSYSQAARLTGRRSGDAVAQLGRRFNREGIPALERRGGKSNPQHLGRISTYTIWVVLPEAGLQWGRTRSWCDTGHARRKRKSGVVTVIDPDTEAKKT